MTTITPQRDAVMRALEQADAVMESSVAAGSPRHCADATKAVLHASLLQFADMAEVNLSSPQILASFEFAFANSILSVVGTVANRMKLPKELVLAEFIMNLNERVVDLIENEEPTVRERVKFPQGGKA
jgi:hypothetical protein